MTITIYTATGTKKGTAELPPSLFEAPINQGLMHQMVVLQQSNARRPIAHARRRGEIAGSTKKLFQQKGTGRARRGPIRSPLMRGGGKAFGPRSDQNFHKDMPKSMRHAALRSCLSYQASKGTILGLENYPQEIKTQKVTALLGKLPVEIGRRILIVLPEKHEALTLSSRNIPGVKTVLASYLNPVDILGSRYIIFMVDALRKAEEVFGKTQKTQRTQKNEQTAEKEKAPVAKKKKSSESSPKKKLRKSAP